VRNLVLVFASALALNAAAQAPFGAEPKRGSQRQSPSTTKETRPFAAQPSGTPEAERCRNYRRQIREVERKEREANTTGLADQLALERQKIVEQQQRAGC
jgi:Flp pilus assembly protein TadB